MPVVLWNIVKFLENVFKSGLYVQTRYTTNMIQEYTPALQKDFSNQED